jgi:sugar/nucleoside kinase (ribokinase family)
LTFALATGMEIPDALTFASERGALALTRRGAGLKS